MTAMAVRPFGRFIKSRSALAGYAKLDELAAAMARSPATLYRIMEGDEPPPTENGPHETTKQSLARALRFKDWDSLVSAWASDDVHAGLEEDARPAPPPNLSRRVPLRHVPLLRGLFASRFRQDPQPDAEPETFPVPATREPDFAAVVAGACMEPDYPEGCTVAFSYKIVERDGPEPGRDYYIELTDSEVAFKRLAEVDGRSLMFVCINDHPDYARPLVVPRNRIRRMARAIWISHEV